MVTNLKFMMITASPEIALFVEQHGVNRIFIDQEVLGKADRQGHLNTHKAAHSLHDISSVAKVLKFAELMVRLNPINPLTLTEINSAIDAGAQRLMLPMFNHTSEVEFFLDKVAGRVPVTFLAETPASLVRIADWHPLLKPGFDEVHFGLNDLTIGMELTFLFEPLAGRLLEPAISLLRDASISWGVGGVARMNHGELSAERVIGEHVRLGSSWVILSRAFHNSAENIEELSKHLDFQHEVALLRQSEQKWINSSFTELGSNHKALASDVFKIVNKMMH